jgi:hypothetical protein
MLDKAINSGRMIFGPGKAGKPNLGQTMCTAHPTRTRDAGESGWR